MNRRHFVVSASVAAVAAPLICRGAAGSAGFEIGLVADAQYADVEPKGTRFYRLGVPRLAEAVEAFNARPLAFCVHLGDLIDREWKSFDDILPPLSRSRHTWHQLLGNHDFEVLDAEKPRVPSRMGMRWRYGSFEHGEFTFVVLDTNDVSVYAHPAGTAEHGAAERELARLQAENLRQAKPWNGAISPAQLAWLDRTCAHAAASRRKVIVFAHHPVFPDNPHNVWNASAVLAVLDKHSNVAAWLNGHNHAGAFAERNGVPFLTLRGMVETPDTTAFATAKVLRDRLIITGHGREPSRELVFRS